MALKVKLTTSLTIYTSKPMQHLIMYYLSTLQQIFTFLINNIIDSFTDICLINFFAC